MSLVWLISGANAPSEANVGTCSKYMYITITVCIYHIYNTNYTVYAVTKRTLPQSASPSAIGSPILTTSGAQLLAVWEGHNWCGPCRIQDFFDGELFRSNRTCASCVSSFCPKQSSTVQLPLSKCLLSRLSPSKPPIPVSGF